MGKRLGTRFAAVNTRDEPAIAKGKTDAMNKVAQKNPKDPLRYMRVMLVLYPISVVMLGIGTLITDYPKYAATNTSMSLGNFIRVELGSYWPQMLLFGLFYFSFIRAMQ